MQSFILKVVVSIDDKDAEATEAVAMMMAEAARGIGLRATLMGAGGGEYGMRLALTLTPSSGIPQTLSIDDLVSKLEENAGSSAETHPEV